MNAEQSEQRHEVVVQTTDGQLRRVLLNAQATLVDLQKAVESATGIATRDQILACAGRRLRAATAGALLDCGIESGSTVCVSQRMGSAPTAAVLDKGAVLLAVDTMKAAVSPADFSVAMRTLATLVKNAVESPDKPQYRRIRLQNKAFASRLGDKPGGVAALRAFGTGEAACRTEPPPFMSAVLCRFRRRCRCEGPSESCARSDRRRIL